jgi:hypothetical protein
MRRLRLLCALLTIAGVASAIASDADAHRLGLVLLGNQRIGPATVHQRAGRAEAFRFTTARAGKVTAIHVYIAKRDRSRVLIAGLYSNRHGHPGSRLAYGRLRSPRRGAWNRISIGSVRIHAKQSYWLAVLSRSGTVYLRSRKGGACGGEESRGSSLTKLPRSWSGRRGADLCPISVQARGSRRHRSKHRSGGGSQPPTPPNPPSQPSPPSPSSNLTGCAGVPGSGTPSPAHLDACGFPSPDTTGVPAGVTLVPVQSATLPAGASWSQANQELTISGSGVTISGLDIDGDVHITGPNATLENSSIHGNSDPEVLLYQNARNTLMKDDDVTAPDAETGAINNASQQPFLITGSDIHDNCTGVLSPGDMTDNYVITDGIVPGCHVEDVYIPGYEGTIWAASPWGPAGPAYARIDHNTLLNPLDQTAAVFLDNHAEGPNSNVTVNDNLMGGGGYVTYGDFDGDGSSNIVITNNRFTRLYHSDGGYYGAEDQNDAATTFSGNIWDDTLLPVLPDS